MEILQIREALQAYEADTAHAGPDIIPYDGLRRFFAGIADPRDRAFFTVVYLYALRVSEATALLRLSHVDLNRNIIAIQRLKQNRKKNTDQTPRTDAKPRVYVWPIYAALQPILEAYQTVRISSDDTYFTGPHGRLSRQWGWRRFKRYAKHAGLDPKFTIHDLRHTIATHLYQYAQLDIRAIQYYLGHQDIRNTMIYTHTTLDFRVAMHRHIEGVDTITDLVSPSSHPKEES